MYNFLYLYVKVSRGKGFARAIRKGPMRYAYEIEREFCSLFLQFCSVSFLTSIRSMACLSLC